MIKNRMSIYESKIKKITCIIPVKKVRELIRNIIFSIITFIDNIDIIIKKIDYLIYEKNSIEESENYIIIKAAGGFTDQIFTYVVGKYIEIEFNRKVLYDISWYKYYGKDEDLKASRNFKLLEIFPNLEFKIANEDISNYYESLFCKGTLSSDEVKNLVKNNKKLYVICRPDEAKLYYEKKEMFDNILDFDKYIYPKLNERNLYFYNKIISNPYSIVVHIRVGDLKKDIQKINKQYFIDAINVIAKKVYPNKPQIFIFSNDFKYVKKILLININKLYEFELVDENDDDNAYIDIYLMTKCKYIISSVGRFAMTAYHFNKNDDKIIINPDNLKHYTDKFNLS